MFLGFCGYLRFYITHNIHGIGIFSHKFTMKMNSHVDTYTIPMDATSHVKSDRDLPDQVCLNKSLINF